ncbi:MAG: RNA polymerase sigma factor [Gemmatimonadaceae bacterium]|nr:RNA polymerase sigma factor [Gemmatimonadaceae bacterium]MDQ3518700.1 RNA polymerase sigma factor [Gemmatimonadota bacterium]
MKSVSIAPSSSSVTELVSRAGAGDNAAFEELYREHAGRVYALCLRLSGDTLSASELTQDVFVRCWERLGSFRGESAFSSWLHRLAVNVALSAHRGDSRRRKRVEAVAVLPDTAGVTRSDARDFDLEKAITMLPAGARTVFVLHDVEGYRHEEIADFMGIAIGTSKAHLFRARRLLRKSLEPQ